MRGENREWRGLQVAALSGLGWSGPLGHGAVSSRACEIFVPFRAGFCGDSVVCQAAPGFPELVLPSRGACAELRGSAALACAWRAQGPPPRGRACRCLVAKRRLVAAPTSRSVSGPDTGLNPRKRSALLRERRTPGVRHIFSFPF